MESFVEVINCSREISSVSQSLKRRIERGSAFNMRGIKADASSGAGRAIGSIGWGWDPVVKVEHEKSLRCSRSIFVAPVVC